MPICPECGIAYMDDERHSCEPEPSTVSRLLPSHWSRRRSLTVFGIIAGLVWAIAPFAFDGFRRVDLLPLTAIAGPTTGIIMSFAMARALRGLGREGTLVVGLFVLPAGTFLFGTVLWLASRLVPGTPLDGSPAAAGAQSVLGLAWVWPLTLLVTPLAMWTTFQLRALVKARR